MTSHDDNDVMLIGRSNSVTATPGLWRELYSISVFYLKIFFGAVVCGSIFFFFYAGIATGRLSSYNIFSTLAAILVMLLLPPIILYFYLRNRYRQTRFREPKPLIVMKESLIDKIKMKIKEG